MTSPHRQTDTLKVWTSGHWRQCGRVCWVNYGNHGTLHHPSRQGPSVRLIIHGDQPVIHVDLIRTECGGLGLEERFGTVVFSSVGGSSADLTISVGGSSADLTISVGGSSADLTISVGGSSADLTISVGGSSADLTISVGGSSADLTISVGGSSADLTICCLLNCLSLRAGIYHTDILSPAFFTNRITPRARAPARHLMSAETMPAGLHAQLTQSHNPWINAHTMFTIFPGQSYQVSAQSHCFRIR